MTALQATGTPTVREIEGAPALDPVACAQLECSERLAVLRFPAAILSGGGNVEARFRGVSTLSGGWPNDEALPGHRLWGSGLKYYAIQEISNSDLIEELERRNAAHQRHRPGTYRDCRHIIITFKEDTFECVCAAMELAHTRR